MEGIGEHIGYFDICFLPHAATQRFLTYMHNGEDKIAFNIKY
jgi:galactokinase